MENNVVQMNLIGYHHFKNKEGTEEYHIVQCAYYKGEELRAQMKAIIIPIFVDLSTFQTIANMTIGSALNVELVPNLETGKIRYNVITLYELCSKTKTNLKEFNLTQDEINDIQIKLQLEGLNLRGGL